MRRVLEPNAANVERAVDHLRAGGVVAFPTETVYGLGADTMNTAAIEAVYTLKQRPSGNPLIAHVADVAQAHGLVTRWDSRCEALAKCFWPGPLTIILPRHESVPAVAVAGGQTIAVRCPNQPVALELLRGFGGAISAPSANRSGHVSPTSAEHVAADFGDAPELLILDGGTCDVGIESTVLDLCGETPRILRRGSVSEHDLQPLLGAVETVEMREQAHSPGTSLSHYAPRTPARMLEREALLAHLQSSVERCVVMCFDADGIVAPHEAIVMSSDATTYAQQLYGALRRADESGAVAIIIERPTGDGALWRAVLDRLGRAAGG